MDKILRYLYGAGYAAVDAVDEGILTLQCILQGRHGVEVNDLDVYSRRDLIRLFACENSDFEICLGKCLQNHGSHVAGCLQVEPTM